MCWHFCKSRLGGHDADTANDDDIRGGAWKNLNVFSVFLAFPANRLTPKYIQYLGCFLSADALGLLIVYCLKDVEVWVSPYGLPELIAIGCIVLLHV